MNKKTKTIINLSYSALCAALIAVSAWVTIPFSAVPVTLQTFAVCAVAGLLGAKWGTVTILVYVFLGVVGLPVFSGFGGGIGFLLGATGGYMIGFFFVSVIVGTVSDRLGGRFLPSVISMAAGLAFCYLLGTLWFVCVYSNETSLDAAFMTCVVPFVIPDAAKVIAAATVVSRLKPSLRSLK